MLSKDTELLKEVDVYISFNSYKNFLESGDLYIHLYCRDKNMLTLQGLVSEQSSEHTGLVSMTCVLRVSHTLLLCLLWLSSVVNLEGCGNTWNMRDRLN